jgi:hypothetical protein
MFEEIIKKLNNLFFNNEKNLKNIVDVFNQIKTRINKVFFTETFIYSLLYTEINKSKRDYKFKCIA